MQVSNFIFINYFRYLNQILNKKEMIFLKIFSFFFQYLKYLIIVLYKIIYFLEFVFVKKNIYISYFFLTVDIMYNSPKNGNIYKEISHGWKNSFILFILFLHQLNRRKYIRPAFFSFIYTFISSELFSSFPDSSFFFSIST